MKRPTDIGQSGRDAMDLRGFLEFGIPHDLKLVHSNHRFNEFSNVHLVSIKELMKTHSRWSHILLIIGFIAMLIGMIDPLEGSVIIFAGICIVVLGAFLCKSRRRLILYIAFGLIAVGVGLLFWLSSLGGVGDNTGRSYWWLLIVLPYPLGWILGIIGSIQMLRDRSKKGETVEQ
jgi:hypothetical protein